MGTCFSSLFVLGFGCLGPLGMTNIYIYIYIVNNKKYLILLLIILSYDIIIWYKLLCHLLKILSLDSLYFRN
jgi:hypothetical protein